MLSEELQLQKLNQILDKQVPKPTKASPRVGVSSSGICLYDTLPAIAKHIRVDVVRGFEASLKWTVTLDCTLTHPCITPVCEKRILSLSDAQTVDFGGRCSFIHCPGDAMESVLHNFSRAYAANPENTSAILALPESG
jgi:hypothetical protein